MNRQQAKGAAVYLIGIIQESFGRAMGNRTQQSKGFDKQIAGKAAIAVGEAVDLLQDCGKPCKPRQLPPPAS